MRREITRDRVLDVLAPAVDVERVEGDPFTRAEGADSVSVTLTPAEWRALRYLFEDAEREGC